jgi:GNAT superfamily N-acetyltransferase
MSMSESPRPAIRPLRPADEEDWRRLWRAYLAFYETELPEAVIATTFARLMAPSADGPYGLIAEMDGRPVGLVHYLFHAHCWRPEGVCYLQDLYAAPEVRGRGVGRALIEAVYAAADAAGKPSVYWMTQEFNHTARRLYDRIAVLTPFIKYARG